MSRTAVDRPDGRCRSRRDPGHRRSATTVRSRATRPRAPDVQAGLRAPRVRSRIALALPRAPIGLDRVNRQWPLTCVSAGQGPLLCSGGSVLVQDIPDTCLTTYRTDVSRHRRQPVESTHVEVTVLEGPPGHHRRSPSRTAPSPRSLPTTAFRSHGSMSCSPDTATRATPPSSPDPDDRTPHRTRPQPRPSS